MAQKEKRPRGTATHAMHTSYEGLTLLFWQVPFVIQFIVCVYFTTLAVLISVIWHGCLMLQEARMYFELSSLCAMNRWLYQLKTAVLPF